jgi:hypothetical protein
MGHGILCLKAAHMCQGIAVNSAMTYSFVESENLPGLTIVAEERLNALADILGHSTLSSARHRALTWPGLATALPSPWKLVVPLSRQIT